MYILKYFMDFSKEEQWLNKLGKHGYQLVSLGIGYKFKKINNNNINYKIDYRKSKNNNDFSEYCKSIEKLGWKHICGSKNTYKQYFININNKFNSKSFKKSTPLNEVYKKRCNLYSVFTATFFVLSLIITNRYLNNIIMVILLFYTILCIGSVYVLKLYQNNNLD
ncbi:DUF2812 domain-containing protein [Clostridium perfringens]|uniref:DUF2812 domain-containing protein n=1 Tax=Clostridium perfringens TaxID=1502 RepID=UPI002246B099|nr:DUF2812 domain-containing protein [Clostridium perfringens]MCX0386936.1 DUF2812 domain-containing protein [Clostridium perfringens]